MRRDAALQTPVQLSNDQIELANRMVGSSPLIDPLLVRTGEDAVDWQATAGRVLYAAARVYLNLLLIQARREQRGIPAGALELARWRQQAIHCFTELGGRRATAERILSAMAVESKLDLVELDSLCEPIRRDLARLHGSRDRKGAVSTKKLPSESSLAPADSNRTSSQSQAVELGGTSIQPTKGDSEVKR